MTTITFCRQSAVGKIPHTCTVDQLSAVSIAVTTNKLLSDCWSHFAKDMPVDYKITNWDPSKQVASLKTNPTSYLTLKNVAMALLTVALVVCTVVFPLISIHWAAAAATGSLALLTGYGLYRSMRKQIEANTALNNKKKLDEAELHRQAAFLAKPAALIYFDYYRDYTHIFENVNQDIKMQFQLDVEELVELYWGMRVHQDGTEAFLLD